MNLIPFIKVILRAAVSIRVTFVGQGRIPAVLPVRGWVKSMPEGRNPELIADIATFLRFDAAVDPLKTRNSGMVASMAVVP